MKGKLLKLVLLFGIVMSMLLTISFAVFAAEDLVVTTYTGKCGTNVGWTFTHTTYESTGYTKSGVLVISGTGPMTNSSYSSYASGNTTELIIEEGVSAICDDAFGTSGYYMNTVNIPDSVKTIGKRAFDSCDELTTLNLGKGVTSIDEEAFKDCHYLATINIPDNVKSIGAYAFEFCGSGDTGYVGIKIGKGLTTLANNAFYLVTPKTITVASENTAFCSKDNVLYSKDMTRLIKYSDVANRFSFTIPDSVVTVGSNAFYSCYNLGSVTIGKNVTTLEAGAFTACTDLHSVYFSEKLEYVGNSAFDGRNIRYIYIPSLTAWCNIEFNGFAFANPMYYGAKLYVDGEPLEGDVVIPEGTEKIGNYAFINNKDITSVTIPSSVKSIGYAAFQLCSNLESVTFSDACSAVIMHEAFKNCKALYRINIPDIETWFNLTFNTSFYGTLEERYYSNPLSLGARLYINGSLVRDVVIPDSVTELQYSTFVNCKQPLNLTVHKNVTSISEDFLSYANLASINVAEENTTYCSQDGVLFNKDKTTLIRYPKSKADTAYSIPNTVKMLNDDSFSKATKLKTIEIPTSVYQMGSGNGWVFNGCTSLSTVLYKGSKLSYYEAIRYLSAETVLTNATKYFYVTYEAGSNITCELDDNGVYTISGTGKLHGFSNKENYEWHGFRDKIKKLVIEEGVTVIPDKGAFSNCTNLESVELPDSLTDIGYSAFETCRKLTSVRFGSGLKTIGAYAFRYTNIAEAELPEGVTAILTRAFGSTPIKSITIPSTVTNLVYDAFIYCRQLKSINVHKDNKNYCDVDGVLFDKNKTTLMSYCFGKTNDTYSLPNTVTTIKGYAFEPYDHSLSSLKTIYLPRNLKTIDAYAFYVDYWSTTKLKDIYYDNTASAWSSVSIGSNNTALSNATMHYTVPVTSIALNRSSMELEIGRIEQLLVTLLPANATNKSITWSSSAPTIATVTDNGVVTAVAKGNAVITATSEDSGLTATCNITVVDVPVIKELSVSDLGDFGVEKLVIDLEIEHLSTLSTVYVAVYDANDSLVDIVSIKDDNLKATLSNKNAHHVKAFVWKDSSTPTCPSYQQSEISNW